MEKYEKQEMCQMTPDYLVKPGGKQIIIILVLCQKNYGINLNCFLLTRGLHLNIGKNNSGMELDISHI